MDQRMELARIALKYGRTRGQFIRENASRDADKQDLQSWSDAYSRAMNFTRRVQSRNLGQDPQISSDRQG